MKENDKHRENIKNHLREIKMKWKAILPSSKSKYYEIKHDPAAGFYLYVFERNICIYDYLQNTIDLAMEHAWEDFDMPKNAWKKIRNFNL